MGAVKTMTPVLLVALLLAVAGCGSGSSTSQNASSGAPQGYGPPGGGPGRGFAQNPKVAACLKKQGVQFGRRRNGRPPAGGRPPGAGTPGQARPGQNGARFKKMQKALKKCGVTMNGPPQGGQGAPPQQPGDSNSSS
jgi:hypothetical protein